MVSRKERLAFCFTAIGKCFKQCNMPGDNYSEFSIKDVSVIQLLGESPLMMSELASELDLTPGSMTTKVDNLISKKFVERSFDKNDRRKVYIQLTGKGKEFYNIILEKHLFVSGELLKKLSSSEQEMYVKLTEKIVNS